MKICGKCGAHNSDERFFCIDCNERLDDPISESEEKRIESDLSQSVEKLYNRTDPMAVTLFDKIFGWGCIAGIIVLAVMFFIALFTDRELKNYLMGFLFLIAGALDAFVPQISWSLEKLSLSFTIKNSDDAEPSDYYGFFRKLSIVICAGIGVAVIIASALSFRESPVADDDSIIVTRGDTYEYIEYDYIEPNIDELEIIAE